MKKLFLILFMCFNLSADAFNNAELAYQKGDDEIAVKYYQEACSQGHTMACNNLGYMYQNSNGVDQNYKLALKNYEKACNNNLMMGCNNIAQLYLNGHGVKTNIRKAKYLFTETCNNDSSGCLFLASMYQYGEGVQKDIQQSEYYYIKSCKSEVGMGCFGLGLLYLGEYKDYVKATRLLQFACDLGEKAACKIPNMNPPIVQYTRNKIDMWNFFNTTNNNGRVEAILSDDTKGLYQ